MNNMLALAFALLILVAQVFIVPPYCTPDGCTDWIVIEVSQVYLPVMLGGATALAVPAQ